MIYTLATTLYFGSSLEVINTIIVIGISTAGRFALITVIVNLLSSKSYYVIILGLVLSLGVNLFSMFVILAVIATEKDVY